MSSFQQLSTKSESELELAKSETTIRDILLDIRDYLFTIATVLQTEGITLGGIEPSDFVYERVASTMDNPVPAHTKKYKLLDWKQPQTKNRTFLLCALGTDQHDNSFYHFYIDGRYMEQISGPASIGSIMQPFKFPIPIKVRKSIELYIDNDNDVPYPNPGDKPSDLVPYEVLIVGIWK